MEPRDQEVFPGWGSADRPVGRPGAQPAVAPVAPAAPSRVARAAAGTRRLALLAALAALVGVLVATAPWPTTAALAVSVWLLQGWSLATAAHHSRRAWRGPRWFDGPALVLGAPWQLLRALPMTLLLLLWSLGIGLAGMLVGYAVEPAPPTVLGLGGAAAAVGLWLGPGASRLRQPVDAVLRPLARGTWAWVVALVVVLVAAGVLGLRVRETGVDWSPADGPPLAGVRGFLG